MTPDEFAALVLAQTQERLRNDYPTSPQWSWEQVAVKPGPVYTKVDIGPKGNMSGKYMIENATGIIYGIKGYGKVHKGHRYGTLETAGSWYWGGYTGMRETEAQREHRIETWLEKHRQAAHGGGLCDCARKSEGRLPVDPDLFARTAPQWNCVAFPGEGMHYLDGQGGCQWCGQTREQIAADTTPRAEVDPERLSGWRGFAHRVRYRGQDFVVSTAGHPDGSGGFASLVFRSGADGKVTDFDDVAGGDGMSREQAITALEARPVDEHGRVMSPRDVLDAAEAAAEAAEGCCKECQA